MCTAVGIVVGAADAEELWQQIQTWHKHSGAAVLLDRDTEVTVFCPDRALEKNILSFSVGHPLSGCSCGLWQSFHDQDGGPALTAQARSDLDALVLLIASASQRWFRLGTTDRYHDLDIRAVDLATLQGVIASGDLSDDVIWHVAKPIRACSFLPAATSIIYELRLEERLHGVTFECPGDRPRVVHSRLEGNQLSSQEIDRIVAEAIRTGETLYSLDMDLLNRIAPDVIFTQHVCNVCQIGTADAERAICTLPKKPRIVPLTPHRLADVLDDVVTVADALGVPGRGLQLRASLQQRLDDLAQRLQDSEAPQRRVMLMEWTDPVYHCGHWVPEMVAAAGGMDELGKPGEHSHAIPWERVVQYDPEVLVIAPCGFDLDRAEQEARGLARRPGWADLSAVQRGEVYLADGNLFTRPSPTLVDGTELLAALFHPLVCSVPEKLQGAVRSLRF